MHNYEQEILQYYSELVKYYEHLKEADANDLAFHTYTKMKAIEDLMKKLQINYRK